MSSGATVGADRMRCTTVLCLMAKLPALRTLSRTTYVLSHWKSASGKTDMSREVRTFKGDFGNTGAARRVGMISEKIGDHAQNGGWAIS